MGGVVVDVELNENEKLNVTEESTNEAQCLLEAGATPEKVNIEQEQEICKETDVKEQECGEGEISKNVEKEEMQDKEMTGNGTVILTEDDTDEVKDVPETDNLLGTVSNEQGKEISEEPNIKEQEDNEVEDNEIQVSDEEMSKPAQNLPIGEEEQGHIDASDENKSFEIVGNSQSVALDANQDGAIGQEIDNIDEEVTAQVSEKLIPNNNETKNEEIIEQLSEMVNSDRKVDTEAEKGSEELDCEPVTENTNIISNNTMKE